MAKQVIMTADKLRKQKKLFKILRLATVSTFGGMFSMFTVLNLVYNGGDFSIDLEKKLSEEKSIVLYDNSLDKNATRKLYAEDLQYMDNISINWIPENIHIEKEGSHNGDNYIAYTFYLENQGEESTNYWYTIFIDDVIKHVDEAIRVMIYRNDEKLVYAKKNKDTEEAEPKTKMFYSDDVAVLEQVKDFKAGAVDKYTIVVFIEGDDPDCINQLIGGEIKLHMEITAEKTRWLNEKK